MIQLGIHDDQVTDGFFLQSIMNKGNRVRHFSAIIIALHYFLLLAQPHKIGRAEKGYVNTNFTLKPIPLKEILKGAEYQS